MKKLIVLFTNILFIISSFSQTHFIITNYPDYTPENANIYIAGNFNGWNPGDTSFILHKNSDGYPEIVLNFSPSTQIEYKFTLGSWQTVEKGPNGEEIGNRTYTFGDSPDTVLITIYNWAGIENPDIQHTYTQNVKIISDSFYIPQLNRYRRIWIYLPPDYDSSDTHYPVIYMHDGQNLFDDATSFSGEWHVDEHLNNLFAQGYAVPIVVGIDNGGSLRINELTPYYNPSYGGGQGDDYIRFIVETLKPYIDTHYKTLPDRENTWIWGSSLGGLISFYAAMKYSNTFSRIGVFSPAFWINDPQIYSLAKESSIQKPTFFYFLAGGLEGADVEHDCNRMMEILENKGIETNYIKLKIDPYGRHNEAFWSKYFEDAYLWLSIIGPESTDTTQSLNYNIYPIPTNDKLLIDTDKYTASYVCQIIGTDGKVRLSRNCTGDSQIDVSSLNPGVYIIIIKYHDDISINRFIKD